ncbi:[Pyruvate dehydrogenase [acetyl-transferring]]-phosphatase 1, mitochondrial [Dinochytrium kinnereticum]|nr:[Pyruvate dehydrogenase [acetyl-transferring]]-phosphatase 1, mitochondrial [Dinochytrium kinnereticum]
MVVRVSAVRGRIVQRAFFSNVAKAPNAQQDWRKHLNTRNAIASIGVAGFLVSAWYLTPRRINEAAKFNKRAEDDANLPIEMRVGSPNLPLKEIDNQVTAFESTVLPPNSSTSIVRIDVDYLNSNDPIEDKNFVVALPKRGIAVGVLDGHWAPHCVTKVQKYLPSYIHRYISKSKASEDALILKALSTAFETLDGDLLDLTAKVIPGFHQKSPAEIRQLPLDVKKQGQQAAFLGLEGSCGLVAYVEGDSLYTAHAGDSRAVLGQKNKDGSWKAVRLTADHTPKNPEELKRLTSEHPGEEKTVAFERKGEEGYPRVIGGMACSRAFGDGRFKWALDMQERITALLDGHPLARRFRPFSTCKTPPYMTAKPDLSSRSLTSDDYFLVLGSDGIFDNLSDEEVVSAVGAFLDGKHAKFNMEATPKANLDVRDGNAGSHLVRTALANGFGIEGQSRMLTIEKRSCRDYRDDMTAAVVFFKPASKYLRNKEQPRSYRVVDHVKEDLELKSL